MQTDFLQSEEWEEFQRAVGRTTQRVNGVLLIRHDIRAGHNYLYSPHPVFSGKDVKENFVSGARIFAKENKSIFLKIDPVPELSFPDVRVHKAHSLQPQKTILLGLRVSEETLLSSMHQKTRYNIRLAERKGVGVTNTSTTGQEKFKIFWELLKETAKRDKFHLHEERYYKTLLEVSSSFFSNELFFAEYKGRVLAAAIVNFYAAEAGAAVVTYLHGASSSEHREVMAPHALHWHIIKEARGRGCDRYDFWGIDEIRWPGLTRFKHGFGGETIEYPRSIDIIYRPFLYGAYICARRFL